MIPPSPSSQSLSGRLGSMARPAQSLKVGIIIGAAMTLRFDMVYRGRRYGSPFTQASLAKVLITIKDAHTNEGPLATVATCVTALALLMVLPTSIAVLFTIAAAVSGCAATAMLTASSWYSCRHSRPNKKRPLIVTLMRRFI